MKGVGQRVRFARILALGVLSVLGLGRVASADVGADWFTGRLDWTSTGTADRTWMSDRSFATVETEQDIDPSQGGSLWIDHGAGSALVNSTGIVAATGYTDGSNYDELVAYVGTDGQLNVGTVVNAGPISWKVFSPPVGQTLSGHLAAQTIVQNGTRYLEIAATTDNNELWVFGGNLPDLTFAGWGDLGGGFTWDAATPLSASKPNDTIVSFFGAFSSSGNYHLGMVRWDGTVNNWYTVDLGAPAGRQPCQSIASAQFYTSPMVGYGPSVVVACTPFNDYNEIYLATTNSFTSLSFTWSTYASANATWYQSIGASVNGRTSRFQQVKDEADIYASSFFGGLGGDGSYADDLQEIVYNGSTATVTDLGAPADGPWVIGGIGVIPSGNAGSRAFFVGNNSYGTRNYLYERWGGSTTSDPQNYLALGDPEADSWDSGPGDLAEGKVSTWGGITASSLINRPGTGGPGDFAKVYLSYSTNEGYDHLGDYVPNVVDGKTLNYVTDPTADVTDQGTIYSVQEGDVMDTCSLNAITESIVYAVSTPPSPSGPSFSAPIVLDDQLGGGEDIIDHPYSVTQHRAGAPDLIHTVWNFRSSGCQSCEPTGTYYAAIVEGNTSVAHHQIGSICEGPRITGSNSGHVIVYCPNVSYAQFCELDDTNGDGIPDTCCIGGPTGTCSTPSNWGAGWQTIAPAQNTVAYAWYSQGVPIPGTPDRVDVVYPFSMAISESGDTLYYCYDHGENNDDGPDPDVFCASGDRNPSTGLWSWNAPVPIAGVTDDGKAQFFPEVVLTQESATHTPGQETAIVTYYDRSADPNDRDYRVMKTASTDGGITFAAPTALFSGFQSDPEYLPHQCLRTSDVRFIGDYAGAEGYVAHAQSLSFVVPNPGQIGTDRAWSFSSLGHWGGE